MSVSPPLQAGSSLPPVFRRRRETILLCPTGNAIPAGNDPRRPPKHPVTHSEDPEAPSDPAAKTPTTPVTRSEDPDDPSDPAAWPVWTSRDWGGGYDNDKQVIDVFIHTYNCSFTILLFLC